MMTTGHWLVLSKQISGSMMVILRIVFIRCGAITRCLSFKHYVLYSRLFGMYSRYYLALNVILFSTTAFFYSYASLYRRK